MGTLRRKRKRIRYKKQNQYCQINLHDVFCCLPHRPLQFKFHVSHISSFFLKTMFSFRVNKEKLSIITSFQDDFKISRVLLFVIIDEIDININLALLVRPY